MVESPAPAAACTRCGATVALAPSTPLSKDGALDRCAVCGNQYFYVQKDFNAALGCGIVLVGIGFSYHTYGLSLLLCALTDFVLYQFLGAVAVCYQCSAEYRGFAKRPHLHPFDMKVAEWHLKRMRGTASSPAPQAPGKG